MEIKLTGIVGVSAVTDETHNQAQSPIIAEGLASPVHQHEMKTVSPINYLIACIENKRLFKFIPCTIIFVPYLMIRHVVCKCLILNTL